MLFTFAKNKKRSIFCNLYYTLIVSNIHPYHSSYNAPERCQRYKRTFRTRFVQILNENITKKLIRDPQIFITLQCIQPSSLHSFLSVHVHINSPVVCTNVSISVSFYLPIRQSRITSYLRKVYLHRATLTKRNGKHVLEFARSHGDACSNKKRLRY